MIRRLVGPFNRVEGDLEVQLEIDNFQVVSAKVNATLFRGFEQMLQGRSPLDALVYAPRICGICSVSQSVAAAQALQSLYKITPTQNGQKAINLMLANENVADLLTHFYLFFMADYARNIYQTQPWYAEGVRRFKAMQGVHTSKAIEARSHWLKMMGTLAGHWPHTLAIQPGGSSRAIEPSEVLQLFAYSQKLRHFLQDFLLQDTLEHFLNLETCAQLNHWHQQHLNSDLGFFMTAALQLEHTTLGSIQLPFMSFGSFPTTEAKQQLFPSGLILPEQSGFSRQPLNPNQISEDLFSAHYVENLAKNNLQSSQNSQPCPQPSIWEPPPLPQLDKKSAYSWCKAPRLDGQVIQVGAIARQMMAQQPLVVELVKYYGSSVYTRMMARIIEMIRLVIEVESWLQQGFEAKAPFLTHHASPERDRGVGLIEAARGSLGHWVTLKNDKIHSYQIIAPTTWNFSPQDAQGQAGPVEQALKGTPVLEINGTAETSPINVQHIVRSFDPCMVCTVH